LDYRFPTSVGWVLADWKSFFLTSIPSLVYVIARAIAARLQEGSVATLGYAQRLFQLPVEVVIMGVLLGTYPMLSKMSCQGNKRQLAVSVDELGRTLLLVSTLIASLMMVLSRDLVEVVFQRGAFDSHASLATSAVLFCIGTRSSRSCDRHVCNESLHELRQDSGSYFSCIDGIGTRWNIVLAGRTEVRHARNCSGLQCDVEHPCYSDGFHSTETNRGIFSLFLFSIPQRAFISQVPSRAWFVIATYNKTGIPHMLLAGALTAILFLGVVLIFEPEQRGLMQKLFRRFGQIVRQSAPRLEISSS